MANFGIKEIDDVITKIKADMMKAMSRARNTSEKALKQEVKGYYDGSKPKIYVRTYTLMKTPDVTSITAENGGETVGFTASLKAEGWQYATGKKPTMTDVLNLTNYGTTSSSVGWLRPGVGNVGYWIRANVKFEQIVDDEMTKYFDRV